MKQEININIIRNYVSSKTGQDYHFNCIAELLEYFYYEQLGWCGCGSPSDALTEIKKYFEYLDSENDDKKCLELFNEKSIYDNTLLLCLAYTLCAAGFTEHGTGIGYSWLTEEGQMFYWLLKRASDEDLDAV